MNPPCSRLHAATAVALLLACSLSAQTGTPNPDAAKLKEQFDHSRQQHAEMIRRIADEEFRASDPKLETEARQQAVELARLARSAERQTRLSAEMRASQFALLNKFGLADQSEQEIRLEGNAYLLPESLQQQLGLFASFYDKDVEARKGAMPTRVYFGGELTAYAATLAPEGRREKLRAFASERVTKLSKAEAGEEAMSGLFDTQFKMLTELLGDAIAGLEAAELLVRLEGHTAEAHAKHAEMLARNGRRDDALRALDVALALDPANERALKWEKQLADNAPELYTGVVEEPADQASLAMLGALRAMGQSPKGRQLLAAEAAARTFGRRLYAALRAPADRRPAALRQAVALHPQIKGNVFDPARSRLSEGMNAMAEAVKVRSAPNAQQAFGSIPLEAATHVVYWQQRTLSFILAEKFSDVLDGIYVVEALDPGNMWARTNRPNYERTVALANQPAPVVAVPEETAPPPPKVGTEHHGQVYQSADAALRQGDLAAAEAVINAALARNPHDSEALFSRARLSAAKRDIAGAQADLQKVIAMNGAATADAHGLTALLLLAQGKAVEAPASIAKALEIFPDQPEALLAQAQLDMRQKNPAAALEKLTRAVTVRPDYEDALVARAMTLVQSGKPAEGIQILEGIVAKNPAALGPRGMLVIQYASAGRVQEARQQVTEISRLKHPNAAQVAAQLDQLVKQFEGATRPAETGAVGPASGKK